MGRLDYAARRRSLGTAPLALLFALLGALGFSFKAVLVKAAYRHGVDTETLLAMRMLYSLPFFIAMAAVAQRRQPLAFTGGDWRALALLGFFGYFAASYLDFLGLQYISAALERVVLFTYPTLVVLFMAARERRWPGAGVMWALGLCYVGVALAVLHDAQLANRNLSLGVLLVLASAVSFAIYLLRCGPAIARLGATRVTAWATGMACVMTLVLYAASRPVDNIAMQPWQVQVLSVCMALFCTVLPIWCSSMAIRHLGAGKVAIIGSLGPILTLLIAWAVLGEDLSIAMVAGALLVILGVRRIAASGGRAGG